MCGPTSSNAALYPRLIGRHKVVRLGVALSRDNVFWHFNGSIKSTLNFGHAHPYPIREAPQQRRLSLADLCIVALASLARGILFIVGGFGRNSQINRSA